MWVGDSMAKDVVKELAGGKELGSSNSAPHHCQYPIGSLVLILVIQETYKALSSAPSH
jgi:hypothetical protein